MLVAAVLPIGSEIVMLYAGAVASGSLGVQATVFGHDARPLTAYLAFCIAAVAGNVTRAALGFKLGAWGGGAFVRRLRPLLPLTPAEPHPPEAGLRADELLAGPRRFAAPPPR